MVMIGAAMQHRLLTAAIRHLGPGGDALVEQIAQETFGQPLPHLTHAQMAELLGVIEQRAPERLGQDVSRALATDLEQLQRDADATFSGRLIRAVHTYVGPAAEPLLRVICAGIGCELETASPRQVPALAAAIATHTAALFGTETAAALGSAVRDAAHTELVDLRPRILVLARQHIGEGGEEVLRRICRERLEVGFDDLDSTAIGMLARAVDESGLLLIGRARVAAFCAAARLAVANPVQSLQQRILERATRAFGPAGSDIVRETCAAEGMPFDAIDEEHLSWIAEVLHAGVASLLGAKGATDFAARLRSLSADREARRP